MLAETVFCQMSLPTFQDLGLPLLRLAADGKSHRIRDAVDDLGSELGLSPEELNELLPSGQQTRFSNRVNWACTYLKKAGLLHAPKRGHFQITEVGLIELENPPDRLDLAYLKQFKGIKEFRKKRPSSDEATDGDGTPDELIARAHQELQENLADELLDQIKTSSPQFFERLVIELLVRMGYGGSLSDAAEAVGKSGDGGIDGIIKEDRLGLDVIYIQAKRWDEASVGRPAIQSFVGAIHGRGASKGVFITTSVFSQHALDYAGALTNPKVILIDGHQLADYMIEHDLGVSTEEVYRIKKVDNDFFDDV